PLTYPLSLHDALPILAPLHTVVAAHIVVNHVGEEGVARGFHDRVVARDALGVVLQQIVTLGEPLKSAVEHHLLVPRDGFTNTARDRKSTRLNSSHRTI